MQFNIDGESPSRTRGWYACGKALSKPTLSSAIADIRLQSRQLHWATDQPSNTPHSNNTENNREGSTGINELRHSTLLLLVPDDALYRLVSAKGQNTFCSFFYFSATKVGKVILVILVNERTPSGAFQKVNSLCYVNIKEEVE
jgi:hypothetical protein